MKKTKSKLESIVLFLGFISLSSCSFSAASLDPKEAAEIFVEQANQLEVVQDNESYVVSVKTDNGTLSYSYYPDAEKMRILFRSDTGNESHWTRNLDGVQPDCADRIINFSKSFQIMYSEGNITESRYGHEMMGIGSYRLLCTRY